MDLAYLDAGSGSQLAMAIVAGFAGAMVAIKVWWRRITNLFRSMFRRRQPTDAQAPAVEEQDG
jgi:hypothetical protein